MKSAKWRKTLVELVYEDPQSSRYFGEPITRTARNIFAACLDHSNSIHQFIWMKKGDESQSSHSPTIARNKRWVDGERAVWQSNQGFVDFADLLIPEMVKYVLKVSVVTFWFHNCRLTIKSVPIKCVT